jgi:hypothetical protein
MVTVKKLYENAFRIGRDVQIKEQTGQHVDGRDIWNTLERTTKELKDLTLTNDGEILQYNSTLKPIYLEMNTLIIAFGMDKSEFIPKSNHFFCQLMNLVDKKSNFEIKLNKIMQIGFNAGQLSVFIENNTLPYDQIGIISNFITKNKMLILDTYVNSITQEIINSKYLSSFNGGKYSLKRRSYRKKKNTSKIFCFNKFRNKK